MCLAEVTVNFFFSVEDLSTLLTHVLASSGFRSTSTFGYLTQLHLTPQYQEKRKKLHKLMCATMITTHLFFFVLFAFFDEFTNSWATFCAAPFSCFLNRHLSFTHFHVFISITSPSRQTCRLHFWSLPQNSIT